MIILSIDVGIKNLALCTFDSTALIVTRWDVISLAPVRDDLASAVKVALDAYPDDPIDRVVIEQQPGRNKRMKAVECYLHMYFVCTGKAPVCTFHARGKLAGTGVEHKGSSGAQYRARKKASVLLCKQWLSEQPQNERWLTLLNAKGSKKDDLADSLNQALAFCKISNAATESTLEAQSATVHARRPTEKQKKRGNYSKSNLKHFLNKDLPGDDAGGVLASLQKNTKLARAALKHYPSLEDCVNSLYCKS